MIKLIWLSYIQTILRYFSLVLLLNAGNVAADDYLNMLEAEADDLSLDRSGQLKKNKQANTTNKESITKKKWKWEGELQEDALPLGLAQDEFATLLKQRFYGTFVFYRRLNHINQANVYKKYQQIKMPEITIIRSLVIKYSK